MLNPTALPPSETIAPSTSAPALGRPKILNSAIVETLAGLISKTGLSDSGAARQLGLSTSSLSRWKKQRPELALALIHARDDFRLAQLDIIMAAAQVPGTGWRAAAWLLERMFPEDYHPNATQRAKFQEMAAARDAESLPLVPEDFPETEEPITPPASVTASQNSQNSPCTADTPVRVPALPVTASQNSQKSSPPTTAELSFGAPAPSPFTLTASQNSQKSRPHILSTSILAAA